MFFLQIDCPLCGDPFPQSKIELHASECDGMSHKEQTSKFVLPKVLLGL
jgi:hypothetical protein